MRTLPSQPFTRQIDVVATSHRAPLAAFAASVKRLTASRVLLLPTKQASRGPLRVHSAGKDHRFGDVPDELVEFSHFLIIAALINDAQHMGFLGDLVEVAANPVKLPHKVVVGGRRRVLGNQAVHQMAQVRLTGKAAALYFFVEGFRLFFVQPKLYVYVAFSHSSESSFLPMRLI